VIDSIMIVSCLSL